MTFGTLFDIIGRKGLCYVFFIATSLSYFILPMGIGSSSSTLWTGYFLFNVLNNFSSYVSKIPIIPDIIQEQSHGVAFSLSLAMINVAALVNSPLTEINVGAGGWGSTKAKSVFYALGAANVIVMFTVCPYIKNIVGSKEHSSRPMAS